MEADSSSSSSGIRTAAAPAATSAAISTARSELASKRSSAAALEQQVVHRWSQGWRGVAHQLWTGLNASPLPDSRHGIPEGGSSMPEECAPSARRTRSGLATDGDERQVGRRHLLNIIPSPVPLGDTNTGATTCSRPAIVRRTPAARAQRHGHLAATPAAQLWKGAAAAEERVEGNERSRDSNRTKRRAIIAA